MAKVNYRSVNESRALIGEYNTIIAASKTAMRTVTLSDAAIAIVIRYLTTSGWAHHPDQPGAQRRQTPAEMLKLRDVKEAARRLAKWQAERGIRTV